MDNEWKELKIDNLPPDILTGDYEFNYGDKYSGKEGNFENDCKSNLQRRLSILQAYAFDADYPDSAYVRYRKPEPKAPTHEEIMTKWWKTNGGWWLKVLAYHPKDDEIEYEAKYEVLDSNLELKSWFTGRESADIPPEA